MNTSHPPSLLAAWLVLIPAGILLPPIAYTKPALSYERQLDEKLVPRGLIIDDRDRALKWLKRIGYYRLSGYLYPFRISPTDDNFKAGSTLQAAIDVYKFDCQLRLLLLQAIDRIEIAIRAAATYHLCHSFGPFGHMVATNYKPYQAQTATEEAQGLDFGDFSRRVLSDEKQSSEVFIDHYRQTYSDRHLPIWMLTEIISFGSLCRILANLVDKDLKRKIARDFRLSQSQLMSWLPSLLYIRNVCAHHGRLWNRTFSVKPELLPRWKAEGITRDRIYVVLLMMEKLLQEIAPRSRWKDRLILLLLQNPNIDLAPMHFPTVWLSSSPWSSSTI